MSNKLLEIKTQTQINNNNRTTISISRDNYTILKKLGYKSECDSMNEVITKILSKEQGVYNNSG